MEISSIFSRCRTIPSWLMSRSKLSSSGGFFRSGLLRSEFVSSKFVRSKFVSNKFVSNKGFAGGASVGLFMASGHIVATVNPDVRLDPGWMSAVANTLLSRADVGVVGSKILYPDGKTIQHAGGVVHYPLATTEHVGRLTAGATR